MESLGLLLIFWYGILHAFGPDHLCAIADFSIGKNQKKTILITILFAFGHGISLFVFAKILSSFDIAHLLVYGDIISASVILVMGMYLLYLVLANKIHLNKHIHKNKEHMHIYFGKEHTHEDNIAKSGAFSIGVLMGIGGVRGMLVTLGAIDGKVVDISLVASFTLGVIIVFVSFGAIILYVNKNFLNTKQNIRKVFATTGIISIIVATSFLIN